MTAIGIKCWRCLHALPWALATLAVRYAVTASIVGLLIWRATGVYHWCLLLALMVFAIGSDARTRALSLLQVLKFTYRRVRIRLTWAGTMHRAKLYEVTHIEDALHSPRTMPGGRKVPKLKRWGRARIRYTPCGMVLTVDGSNIGAGVDAFAGDQAVVLKAKWRALDIYVDASPRHPYWTELRLIFTDPFASVIRPSQLPPPPYPPTGVCTVGKDSDGRWVHKDARLANLIAGAPGAGKSSEDWALLYELDRQGLPFRTRVYDPKGGQEFFDLETAAYRYESNATAWCEFLTEALAAMAAQQASLRAAGYRKWSPDLADRWPLDVMIIDELVTVIAMMAGAKNTVTINGQKVPALKAFLVYLSQQRAAGFSVIANTQLTQKEAIGLIRDLFAYVTCLRVGSEEMVRTVLGDPKTYPAHRIPVGDNFAGIGYMADPGSGRAVKYRAFYLEDAERSELAKRIAVHSAKYREQAKHDKGTPIVLDLGDDDLSIDETEQAVIDELVQVCQKCQTEFIPDPNLVTNGAAA